MKDLFNDRGIFLKILVTVVGFLVVSFILLRMDFMVETKTKGKTLYSVEVINFTKNETYLTSDYTRDEKTGCISFKDMLGVKRTVCNNYTISEY